MDICLCVILSVDRKGLLNTPCLDFGICTSPNTVCSQGRCVCAQYAYDSNGLCGT